MPVIPNIIIEQQRALIGIESTYARLHISTPRPKMRLKQELPQMEIERKSPEFKLNWQKVRDESGLMNPVDKTLETAGKSCQKALEGTTRTVKDGDYVGKVEIGGNRIAQVSRKNMLESQKVDVNIGTMPQSLPEVQWDPGYLNISWSDASLQVEWDSEFMPTFSVEPHSIEIFLRQKPYIKITLTDELMLKSAAGRRVDQEV